MANADDAVQFVLRQEDSRLTGDITTLPGDAGGPTRFGLASRWHPELVARGFYELVHGAPRIGHDEALTIAEETYGVAYIAALHIDQIASQEVADRLLSFAVNEGKPEAVTILQRCLNGCGCAITVDGIFGPQTLKAVNSVDPARLIAAQRSSQEGFYRHLVAVRPALLPYLNGLLNRARA